MRIPHPIGGEYRQGTWATTRRPSSLARGLTGRPSDRGESTGVLAQRPREPAGEPPPRRQDRPGDHDSQGGRARLVPNPTWRSVQIVQAHMAVSVRKGRPRKATQGGAAERRGTTFSRCSFVLSCSSLTAMQKVRDRLLKGGITCKGVNFLRA